MVRADLLGFPSFSGDLPALAGVAVARPAGMQAQFAPTYSALGQDVARDVGQFIAQGGTPLASAASPQAHWLALQAARQVQSDKQKDAVERSPAAATALKPEQQAFLQRIAPWAQQAAERLGVSARSVMAHAALESGWGQRPLRDAQGGDALNLFGIKAMGAWQGASVQALTTEVQEDGAAVKQTQAFRQYADLDSTFADYVQLLGRSPRYRAALQTGDDVHAFGTALAQGGYATDPQYADKLLQVSRAIPARP